MPNIRRETEEDELLRPTFAEVDLDRITLNYRAIRHAVGRARMLPVLKANAYGHGLVPVARHLESLAPYGLAVAFLDEAMTLRRAGITCPILVMGGITKTDISHFIVNNLMITVGSVAILEAIEEEANRLDASARVHIKIDTGMGRVGVSPESAAELFTTGLNSPHVQIEAIYSHLATADEADGTATSVQLERFLECVTFFADHGEKTPDLHIANSGGILQHPASHLDIVRPGILLFGVYPSAEVARSIEVSPALAWKSGVSFFKVQPAGSPVSYGSTWAPGVDTGLATIPAGYGDGYFRALSNKGEVLIGGLRHPIVGRICMDQFMVDIGSNSANVGDEVVLMGVQGDASVQAADIAGWADTISYEVLSNIGARVPRMYVGGEPDAG